MRDEVKKVYGRAHVIDKRILKLEAKIQTRRLEQDKEVVVEANSSDEESVNSSTLSSSSSEDSVLEVVRAIPRQESLHIEIG